MSWRPAFTRIELAVAIVVLVVLLGLLIPSTDRTRDTSRRVQCAARQGELMKAVQQFEMAHQRYPGYVEAFGQDPLGNVKVGTWVVALLPYLEQEPLYELWQDAQLTDQWNRRGGGTNPMNSDFYPKLVLLLCSSDPNSGEPTAPLSFAVNCGFFADTLPPGYESLNDHDIVLQSTRPANGVFSNQLPAMLQSTLTGNQPAKILGSAAHRPTRAADIRDGLTMTIGISENLYTDSWAYVGRRTGWAKTAIDGQDYYGDETSAFDSIRAHVGLLWLYKAQPKVAGVPDYEQLAPPGSWSKQRRFNIQWAKPNSRHTGLANVAFLGGSVSTLSNTIDYRVYQSLLAPQDANSDVPDKSYKLLEDDFR